MKKSKVKRIAWLIGGVTLSFVGMLLIPPLITDISNKTYKNSLQKSEVNMDDMGPVILPHNQKEDNNGDKR